MQIKDIMTREVWTCAPTDSINRAAQLMWEGNCGCVPIVEDGKVVGILTDRDVCMAAYTQGRPLCQVGVGSAATSDVVVVGQEETVLEAERKMNDAEIRRVPVVDGAGRLVGILSRSDIATRATGNMVGVSATAAELKDELKKSMSLLQTLRDEVRVRLHLGSREIQDQWRRLEPSLLEIERKAEELGDASRTAVADAVKKLESFRATLLAHH